MKETFEGTDIGSRNYSGEIFMRKTIFYDSTYLVSFKYSPF